MDAAGTRSGQTNSQIPRVFRICAGHEGSGFFMTHMDKTNVIPALPQRLHDSVNAVPGQSKNLFDAPVDEALHQNIRACLFHKSPVPMRLYLLPGERAEA